MMWRHEWAKGIPSMAQTTRGTQNNRDYTHYTHNTRPGNAPRLNAGGPSHDPKESKESKEPKELKDTRDPQDSSLVDRVAQEREPRQHALRRGRFLLVSYIILLVVVVSLTIAARTFSILPGDLPFTRELQETTNPIIAGALTFISAIGYPTQSAILLLVAMMVLWIIRLRLEALFVALSSLADALGAALKVLVGRHRPLSSVVHVVQRLRDASFPSGHTLHYTVFYGFLIFVVATNFRPSWPRTLAIVLLAIPIALVGLSRVYLGAHWPTDVIGGYLIGALCLIPLIAGYMWTKQRFTVVSHPPFLRRL